MTKALLTSNNQNWRTPYELVQAIEFTYDVVFEYDLAACTASTKCANYFSVHNSFFDNINNMPDGSVCFCNPPYGDEIFPVRTWATAAYTLMIGKQCKIYMLLPTNKFEQDWWHRYVIAKNIHFSFIKGRVDFLNEKGIPMKNNTWGSVVVAFDTAKIGLEPGTIDYERPKHYYIK